MRTAHGLGLLCAASLAACGNSSKESGENESSPTWYGGIEALLVRNCSSCHTAEGVGPFALDDYETAKSVAPAALEAVQSNRMPPWLAQDTEECSPPLPWQDDIRLNAEEKQLLADWIAADMPLGDPDTAIAPEAPPSFDLENPAHVMSFEQPFAVSGESDLFECFVLDPKTTEKSWITGVQVTAGNDKVDHHAIIFLDNAGASEDLAVDGHFPCFSNPDIDGSLIGAWAPGALPFKIPPQGGIPMEAGARIVVQMHYHPVPGTEMDLSTVSIETTSEQPQYDAVLALLGNYRKQDADGTGLQPGMNDTDGPEFRIPAGAVGHVENLIYRQEIDFPVPIFGVGAHMHYVGTDMKIDLVRAQGSEGQDACLLHTPKWDFDWQRSYNYDAPIEDLPVMGVGDELHLRCIYDNSMDNPAVADAVTAMGLTQPVDVYLGEETLDEMCLGVFGALVPPGLL